MSHSSPETTSPPTHTREGERIDKRHEILELEANHIALGAIKNWYNPPNISERQIVLAPLSSPPYHGVRDINNQFAQRILPAFLADNEAEGLGLFRSLEPHTTNQELALLIGDEDFIDIRNSAMQAIHNKRDATEKEVDERLKIPTGQIDWNDRYQFSGKNRRSLEKLESTGIVTYIDPESHNLVASEYEKSIGTKLPMIESLKNERIATINGFGDSKISHVVHDAIDHMWGFQLIKRYGLDKKFDAFWQSIGDPMSSDIFKREGEIVSSIGFGVRYGSVQENGFRPLISGNEIRVILEKYFDENQLEDRHLTAFRILRSLPTDSREILSLGFTYSNYVTELSEQRRKHGKIKQIDHRDQGSVRELSPMSPDFLSLFIELHHQILSPVNKHRDNIFRIHIMLEDYLRSIATGNLNIDEPFIVNPSTMQEYDFTTTSIPTEQLQWMFTHYGFTATKEAII